MLKYTFSLATMYYATTLLLSALCGIYLDENEVLQFSTHTTLKVSVNNCTTRCDYIQFYYISANSFTCFG